MSPGGQFSLDAGDLGFHRYLQVQVELSSNGGRTATPRLDQLSLDYLPDATVPDLDLSLASMPGYTHLPTGTTNLLYYGQVTGSYTLTVTAGDTGSGIAQVVLPNLTSAGATFYTAGAFTHTYTFLPADTLSGTFGVTAQDNVGQVVTEPLTVINDSLAPTSQVTAPLTAPLRFPVTWLGVDNESGLRHYEVQFREAVTTTWTPWLTGTTETEAEFVGSPGGSYYFRVRAVDNVSNTRSWQEGGPVVINTVLFCP